MQKFHPKILDDREPEATESASTFEEALAALDAALERRAKEAAELFHQARSGTTG
jgi:hypothetical protein